MGIKTTTVVTVTCDHCGRTIDPATETVFRVRIVAEAGDGNAFRPDKDETLILCPTDALTSHNAAIPVGQAQPVPPYPN